MTCIYLHANLFIFSDYNKHKSYNPNQMVVLLGLFKKFFFNAECAEDTRRTAEGFTSIDFLCGPLRLMDFDFFNSSFGRGSNLIGE
jgi:hypothetical protein